MKFYRHDVRWDEMEAEDCEAEDGEWATRDDAEKAAKERDEFERKLRELCQAHGALLIKFHDAAKDAVWAAKLAQQAIYELYNGKPAHMRDYGYVASQAIIERYEGGTGNG